MIDLNMRGSANIYNLPEHLRARAMCAVTADTEQHRFIVGTCSISPLGSEAESRNNEVHLLSYLEDANRIDVDKIFKLPAHAEVS